MSDRETAESLAIQNPVPPGIYQHYKTKGLYQVLCMARHSETLEEMVVYQDTQDKRLIWSRPAAMFLEEIIHEEQSQPRFRFIQAAT